LPRRPAEPDPPPRLCASDATRRALGELTRGSTVPTLAPPSQADVVRWQEARRGPPAPSAVPHAWTNRGAPEALALLSILRL
jgi:hypothetical protein